MPDLKLGSSSRYFFLMCDLQITCGPVPIPLGTIWVGMRDNMSSGIPTRSYPNQPAQQQRLAWIVKYRL